MLNDHHEAEKNGDTNSTMLHYVRLDSNLKSIQFDDDTGMVSKLNSPKTPPKHLLENTLLLPPYLKT